MNNTKEYITEIENEILNATLGLIKIMFESDREIIPHLIFANESTILGGIKENNKFGIAIAHIGQLFSVPTPIRNLYLHKHLSEIKPFVISLIAEAWYVDVSAKEVDDIKNPLKGVQPKDHPEREEVVLIHIISPFNQRVIQYPIISDFLNINNGVPKKILGEKIERVYEQKDTIKYDSFFTDIYNKTAPSISEIEKVIEKL